ncbi:MAG TPA: 50S ribosomal protein L11 methyltransferase [Anaerovoracaceae bacterium]|nr:50S ribosomal protein L11 methyltransferase [Anaerovoracaceae bacterium]
MKYIEIKIHTNEEGIEPIVGVLLNLGITDTVVEDPKDVEDLMEKKNDYDWDYLDESVVEMLHMEPMVTVYLEDNAENREKARAIEAAINSLRWQDDTETTLESSYKPTAAGISQEDRLDGQKQYGSLRVETSLQSDEEWKDNWKEYFKPAKISEHIVVKPTWETYENKDNSLVIEIDPGMAFGTGTHETTSLCVKLMEKYQKQGDKVLDVGCGSGILSIAGALLGASEVLGVDIDPIAVEVTQENIKLNNLQHIARAQYGDLTKGIDFRANIIAANLMADLVMMLSSDVSKHLLPGGVYISSGILVTKEEQVAGAIRDAGFEVIEIMEDGEWCAIAARVK